MANGGTFSSSPDHHPHPSSRLALFINTNLDTHLVLGISPDDTVAQLKGRISIEHASCFPHIGEVSVQAVKVKRRASYYNLSDSMPLKSAFGGTNGTWFLNLDLVPAIPIIRSQPEIDRVISESGGQPEKHAEHGNVGVEANVDVLVSKKERSRKRHTSEHNFGEKKKRKKEKNQYFDEPVKDQITGQNLESGEYSKEMTQLEKVLPKERDPYMVALERFPCKPSHIDSSVQQAPIVDKQEKNKHRLSENDGASQDEPFDNTFNNNNAAPVEQQAANESHSERLVSDHDHTNIEKELDVVIEEIIRKVLGGGSAEIGLSKQSNDADICREGSKQSSLAQADSEVPANSCSSRKRSKTQKGTSFKSDALDSPLKPLNEKTIDEESGNNGDKLNNFSDMDMTDADLGRHAAKSGSPSKFSVKSPKHSRKKNREKKELPKTPSNIKESLANNLTEDSRCQRGKEHEGAAVFGGAAMPIPATVNLTVSLNPDDKKSNHIKKRSREIEFPGKESSKDEVIHDLVTETNRKIAGETLNGSSMDIGGNSMPETILKEAAVVEPLPCLRE